MFDFQKYQSTIQTADTNWLKSTNPCIPIGLRWLLPMWLWLIWAIIPAELEIPMALFKAPYHWKVRESIHEIDFQKITDFSSNWFSWQVSLKMNHSFYVKLKEIRKRWGFNSWWFFCQIMKSKITKRTKTKTKTKKKKKIVKSKRNWSFRIWSSTYFYEMEPLVLCVVFTKNYQFRKTNCKDFVNQLN